MESTTEGPGWLAAIQALAHTVYQLTYLPAIRENWWAATLLCALLAGLSNIAITDRLRPLFSPSSKCWLLWAGVFAVLPYMVVTAGWQEYSEEATSWVLNAIRAWCVLFFLLVGGNIETNGNGTAQAAAVWCFWSRLVAWMPANLVSCAVWPWWVVVLAISHQGATCFLVPRFGFPLPEAEPLPLDWREQDSASFKSRLRNIGLVVRGFARAGNIAVLLLRGFPSGHENPKHARVWAVYFALTTIVPMYLLARMYSIHALQSGAVVRFAVRLAPPYSARWIIQQGAGVNGAAVNAYGMKGDSALALAVLHGHASTVAALLAAGADVHATNHPGETPLMSICPSSSSIFGTHRKILADDTSIVRMLLDAGADVNAIGPQSRTLLYCIISRSNLDEYESILHSLLDAGGDLIMADYWTNHILEMSRRPHRPNITDMLRGALAYQAHLAPPFAAVDMYSRVPFITTQALLALSEPEVLVHTFNAMRRQAWSRRRRAVTSWQLMANEMG